jgi:gliding motility-associated-like protein
MQKSLTLSEKTRLITRYFSAFFFVLIIFWLVGIPSLKAQTSMVPCGSPVTTLTMCGGVFADPGGSANYANSCNVTETICPGTAGQCVTLQFTSFNLETNWDYLYIYNGNTTGAPLIGTYTGTTIPNGGNVTANNASGCLTLVFTSDGVINAPGWLANVICTPCGSPPPPPPGPIVASDCSGAVNICTNSSFQVDPSGSGSVTEFTSGSTSNPSTNPGSTNSGCLLSGELNSTWMVVNIASTGTLEFSFGADGGTGCLDWIMWPYNGSTTCNAIINNTQAPIRCNWNGMCESFTGMATPLPAGGDPTNFEPELNVTCGQRFLICLSNYSSQSTSIPLNFFGTATISCTTFTPITVNSATICPGGSAVLTANGGNTYTWSPGGTLSATTGNPVTATPATTTSYTVTGTGPCGTGTATAVVTVLPANDPACVTTCTATATNTGPYCVGQTIQLNGTGGGTYAWTGPNGFTSAAQNPTLAATTAAAGTYTLTITVGTCTATATTTVVVNAPTTPTFTQVAAICSGGSFTLPTTSNNGITGTWAPAINNTATTTYTFTPTAGQCATTTTMTVTVNAPVTPTFTQVAPICSGGSFTLPTTSNNGITGTWAPGINNTATTTYTFTPTAGQCANTTTMTVTVNAPVTPTFTQVAAICSGGSFTLPATSTNGITGTWAPAINNTATTTYTFTPTAGQCAITTTMTVTVNPQITPAFNAHPPICSGGTITLPTTSTNGITGTWAPAINNTATTTYTFTPTAGQCATTTTMTVTVGAPVTPTFTAIAPICQGGTINLPATSNDGFTGTWSPAVNNMATTTYTFTPTAGQCATTTTLTVTVNTPVTPTFNAIGPICSGDALSLLTTSLEGITGTWSPAVNNTATTTYTFTPDAGQCANTTTLTVTVNPIPTMTAPGNIAACPGDNIAASVFSSTPAGASFTWTNSETLIGLGASGTGNTPSFSATNGTGSSISGTISVTPTLNGCTGSPVTYTITVNDVFDATITPAGPFCANAASVTLTAVDAGGTWSGTGITDAVNGIFDPATAGAGTFTITYTIGGSCGSTDTENIIVNPVPLVDPISNIAACEGDIVAASAFTSTPAGATFTWTNDNTSIGLGASGTGNTNSFTATNGTGSAITGTVSVIPTLNGCIGLPVTYTITVNDQFDATITPAGPFCESDASYTLTAFDAGGTWGGTGITDIVNGIFDPATAGAGTYTITYTIGGSCGDVQTTSITVNPDMNATITPAGPFCTNDPALTLSAVDGGGTWGGTGITNTSLGIFDPSIAGAGTHTITYSITGMCGDTQTITIIVADDMDATITPQADVCEMDANLFFIAADPGGTWTGNGIINASTGEFDPSSAGVGTHTITYTISGNCGDIQTTTINVLNNADATITQVGPYCIGNSPVTLTAVDLGGTWSGTGITDPVNGIFDPAVAGVGTHAITYTITGQCGDFRTIFIDVVANFDATITQVGPFCEDASTVDLVTVNGGGTFTGNGITDAVNGIFDPAVAGPGTHTITYTIPGPCGDIATIDIVVNALPVVSFSPDNTTGCVPLTVTFTDNTGLAGSSVIWSMSDGFISSNSGSVTHTFTSVGCFDVTLQVTSAQGCVSSITQNDIVCTSAVPVAEFSWNPTNATILNPVVNFVNESTNATNYVWDFAGLGSSTATNPTFTFPSDSARFYLVCLEAYNSLGCADTVCHYIQIFDEFLVYVPNAFTPDNDGINDVFLPVVNGHDPLSYQLLIFNRWGELIFESQHDNVGWNGTYKTVISKEDTYVWKLKLKSAADGKQHDYIGHVNLLK